MGCARSREARHEQPELLPRSHSVPYHRQRHRLSSNSPTPYSVKLGSIHDGSTGANSDEDREATPKSVDDKHFSSEVRNAKKWSEMIEMVMPKTSPRNPEAEDNLEAVESVHNPLRHFPGVERSFSFNGGMQAEEERREDGCRRRPPDSSTNYAGSHRKKALLAGLPPLSPSPAAMKEKSGGDESKGGSRIRRMRTRMTALKDKMDPRRPAKVRAETQAYTGPPGGQKKVVLYFTSLRGIRKTYEDCCETQAIIKGYGVRIDERDVSMHSGFKDELVKILGPGYGGAQLPRVFANGQYLGGVDEIRLIHEAGKLSKALKGCCKALGSPEPCDACGGMRFVPCKMCNGSCKVFVEYSNAEEEENQDVDKEENVGEDEQEKDSEDEETDESGEFRQCPVCNENGLVRCPYCCTE